MRPLQALSVGVLCLLAACSGSSDPKALTDQGAAALTSGDARAAAQHFEDALKHMDAKHPDFLRASMGRCQALARQDAKRAKTDFLALAKTHSNRVREPDFGLIVGELVKKGALAEATEVVTAGMTMFPESPKMAELRDKVGDAAKASSDPDSMKALKGLGYAGGDE
ncbi:MAG: hypothetical protein ACKVWV_15800 [Planctomycetota bacterium]